MKMFGSRYNYFSHIIYFGTAATYISNTYKLEIYFRYLGCSELRRSGCRGRATLPVNGDSTQLKLTHPHNHPPDLNAEEKVTFMKELKRLVKQMNQCTLKHVYETVAEL